MASLSHCKPYDERAADQYDRMRPGGPRAVIASISRIFMNEQMHWTLEATCSECLTETVAPLVMGVPIICFGCGVTVKIDARKTVFHRRQGTGRFQEVPRRFRWGTALPRH